MFFRWAVSPYKKKCKVCGKESIYIAENLGICRDCIIDSFAQSLPFIDQAHEKSRVRYQLPPKIPKDETSKVMCNFCSNLCVLSEGQRSFCGLRYNKDGKLYSDFGTDDALMHWYLDPHVTNCVAAWFCPAATGIGYPKFAYKDGAELGYYNLAVFFYGCNFDCLFCQNFIYKHFHEGKRVSVTDFTNIVLNNEKISCICYFGGSPEPQLPFVVKASKRVLNELDNRIVRICVEWNGCGNPSLVKKVGEMALQSGGIIKFDLKTYSENLSMALSGVSNKQAYSNFEMLYHEFYEQRPEIPILTASTLLVPGYVNSDEVEKIASFISELNPNIPYSLLIFHPDFMMLDLPVTPYDEVVACFKAARKHLKRVHVGNLHLIGFSSFKSFLKSIS